MNKHNVKHGRSDQRGSLIILSLIVIFAMSSIGLSIAQTVLSQYSTNKQRLYAENAIGAAEAGISATRTQLKSNSSFAGYADTSRQALYNDTTRGKADYSTTVSSNADGTKTITSTGYAYKPGDTTAFNTKRIRAIVKQQTETIVTPNVYAGSGGLYLHNGAVGPDTNSSIVNVLGKITMTNHGIIGGSPITGPAGTIPKVNVANMACASGGNYPVACPSNQEPLQLSGFSRIYANVCATNQVTQYTPPFGNEGVFAPGTLQPNCTAPVAAMPSFDKQGFINDMTSSAAASTGSCFTGSVTWAANRTYTGNVSGSLYCNITVAGNVYISGNLSLSTITLQAQNGLTTPPTIIVNGPVSINSNSVINANNLGVGVRIISFHSTNSTCSSSPSCTTLSSADAQASVGTAAITCQFCRPDGSILWSYFGRTSLGGGPPFGLGAYVGIGAVMGASVAIDGYSYGMTGGTWMATPPGTVTVPGDFSIVDYQQLY